MEKPIFYTLSDSGVMVVPHIYIKETEKSHKYRFSGGHKDRYFSKKDIKEGILVHFQRNGYVFGCGECLPMKDVMIALLKNKVRIYSNSVMRLEPALAAARKNLDEWTEKLEMIELKTTSNV